jgi:hypothetical protein
VGMADFAGLPTPVELPELVAAAARWAKAQR